MLKAINGVNTDNRGITLCIEMKIRPSLRPSFNFGLLVVYVPTYIGKDNFNSVYLLCPSPEVYRSLSSVGTSREWSVAYLRET